LGWSERPLSNSRTFINVDAKTFNGVQGTSQRATIFGGQFHQYSEGMEQDMSKAGTKIGPGPAIRNIGERQHKPYRSKSSMSRSLRKLGEVLYTKDFPSSAHYHI
jgi:hypothetical protein